MAVTTRVSNATKNFLMPKLVEGVLQGNIGVSFFLVRAKKWRGAQEEVPFKFEKNANGGSFTGFDLLNTAAVDNTIKLTYDAAFNEISVVLPKSDLSLNDTEEKVADLMERQIMSDAFDLADNIGNQFYGDGTGNGGKDLLGLEGIVDDGTNVATIGGQARATYPALNGSVTASGGALTLALMYAEWDNVQEGMQEPSLILTTKTVRSLYNQLLEPKERYTLPVSGRDKLFMTTGAEQLAFRSAPIVADSKCPAGLMYFLNERSLEFRALPKWPLAEPINFMMEAMDGEPSPEIPKGLGFHWTGWVKPVNQEAIVGRVIHAGNFIVKNPRYNGKLTGITSI